jgi:DnaK suppressor protein
VAKTQSVLTQVQLETLRRKLQDERRRVLSVVQQPLSGMPPDEPRELEETAQRARDLEDELEVDAPESALLREIDRALGKMDAGTYGVSEKTGAPIPYERLAAVPWARYGAGE